MSRVNVLVNRKKQYAPEGEAEEEGLLVAPKWSKSQTFYVLMWMSC